MPVQDITGGEFAVWMIALGAFLWVLNQGGSLYTWMQSVRKSGDAPAVLPVSLQSTLATKEDLSEVEGRVEGKISGVKDELHDVRKGLRDQTSNVHRRIDGVIETLSELKGSADQINQNVRLLLAERGK